MTDYDLYAVSVSSLDDALGVVTAILAIPFSEFEDRYTGRHFLTMDQGDEVFTLRENLDPRTGAPVEPGHADHRFLFYVGETERGEALRRAMAASPTMTLLRHETIGRIPPIHAVRID